MTRLTTLGGLNLLRTGGVHFDVSISLADGELAPLNTGDADIGSTATFEPGAQFEITIEKAHSGGSYTLDNIEIRVFVGKNRVHEEKHDSGSLSRLGTHKWSWDGFIDGRFSNWRTHDAPVQVMVIAWHYPLATGDYGSVNLEFENDSPGWFDIDIDRNKKEVDVWLRFGLAWDDLGTRLISERLTKLFIEAVERYWSRTSGPKVEIEGEQYTVTLHPKVVDQDEDDTLDFDVYVSNDSEYARSHNFGVIDGRIAYNAGHFLAEATAAGESNPKAAARIATDNRFRYTSAHEFGHTVLSDSSGKHFSLTHKGSSGLDQQTHDASPVYPPSPDEIDLMVYYADADPSDYYQRVHASNDDIPRLLSIGKAKLT